MRVRVSVGVGVRDRVRVRVRVRLWVRVRVGVRVRDRVRDRVMVRAARVHEDTHGERPARLRAAHEQPTPQLQPARGAALALVLGAALLRREARRPPVGCAWPQPAHLGEISGRYRGDVGEMQGRYWRRAPRRPG